MCEPAHSIVQYPDRHDDDEPFAGQMTMGQKIQAGLGKAAEWGKKIFKWWHFSKLGSGHSEAIQISGRASLILPEHVRYEGLWWDRNFITDGPSARDDIDNAYACAKQYHENMVMQNMSTFRRFLESSIEKSSHPAMYYEQFISRVLNKEGQDKLIQKLRSVFGPTPYWRLCRTKKLDVVKVMMGFTRKREFFKSHFADDPKLWSPG